jgi:hypothetical protein
LLCGFIDYGITVANLKQGEKLFFKKRVQRDDEGGGRLKKI